MDVRQIVDDELGLGEDRVKVTVVLPRALYEDLRLVAYEGHTSQNAVVRRALRAWLFDGRRNSR